MENKKIKNAQRNEYNGIQFKSVFEKQVYVCLKEAGFDVLYEPYTYTLVDSFTPRTKFYDKETPKQRTKRIASGENEDKHTILIPKTSKISSIKYTPDFMIVHNGVVYYIEAKGIENDVYYLKKKLFRLYLDKELKKTGQESMFFEVYTKHQVNQVIDIINNYKPDPVENATYEVFNEICTKFLKDKNLI